ncbi:MAG: universal stress protein [Chloroflexi bacterium]|nr:universal stress protein [Chloroflexota bacterium]MCI0580408.1 universal stress protein [Chloroflexota bacterium]MCI0650179.1 universal stress protein [Chloroflexota bacterium]MCI0729510.1 universal stress protein [Chloroflexota bacterium]
MESFYGAVSDFRRARQRAALQEILARLTGRSTELLSYEDVRQKVRASGVISRSLKEIPLDAIVGSVGRYHDFTRSFLPRQDSDEERWARVKVALHDATGLPPIEVYQIGDAYFVHDGHHRVSVARELGVDTVQAYVTQIRSKVPLSPEDRPEDLIIKAEYAEFLEQTQLDESRPEADLRVTEPGQYQELLEHIEVHRHYMGIEQQREIPYEEAVAHWYDTVYRPVVEMIREQGILRDFPERAETDLYLWIAEHRAGIEEELEWEIPYDKAAADLAGQFSSRLSRVISRLGEKILEVVVPDELEPGPTPGEWRRERQRHRRTDGGDHLFNDILVPVSGEEVGWYALEQAIAMARREEARLYGLHVLPAEERKAAPEVQKVRDRFKWRCGEVGAPGDLVFDVGPVPKVVCERARWTDLVVMNLSYPPGSQPLARLGSGFRTVLRRCPRPVLATPGKAADFEQALLAYDGSPKAREALFVAAYLAGRWQMPLVVVTVWEKGDGQPPALVEAQEYLAGHGVEARYISAAGPTAEAILTTAEAYGCDWLIMGGYGANPVVEVVLGSVVEKVLQESERPVLICQ